MNEVTARANPGSLIQLDQCPQCGGIWCDKWELFPLDTDEAGRLEPVDAKRLSTPVAVANKTLYCPRCTAKLAVCNDPLLPKDIILQRCGRCEGIWLNRGQLTRYKNFQRSTRLAKMGPDAIVHKLPEVFQNPKAWVVTGTKGMFAYPQGVEESQETLGESLHGAFKVVLQSLIRMVLGI